MLEAEMRLQGAPNFRDLGGYRTVDGKSVRHRRVFRSDGLNKLTGQDFLALSKLGLGLVCDLRSEPERIKKPTLWSETFTPETVWMEVKVDVRAGEGILDLLKQDPTERMAADLMTEIYRLVPGVLSQYLSAIFDAYAVSEKKPLVFHCSAGKDRTGVLSAITLLALGVPKEAVYEDYLKTERYQDHEKINELNLEYLMPIFAPQMPPPGVLSALSGVRESYLDASLAVMGEKQGSINDYLHCAGITQSQIGLLRAKLLE